MGKPKHLNMLINDTNYINKSIRPSTQHNAIQIQVFTLYPIVQSNLQFFIMT